MEFVTIAVIFGGVGIGLYTLLYICMYNKCMLITVL